MMLVVNVDAGNTLVWMTVEPGSVLKLTEVAMTVEAGNVTVEPGWVIVDAGTIVVAVKLAVIVEAAKVVVVGTGTSVVTVNN
jgi:hypothetical protein